ncbi:MAG: HdeD family acid-resistance protein [Proteobacteria bacterium]|nr:HdeD family acid-resistance protein [Pseudomonadota bacterium]MCL2307740.1 HdeD family acid-resistance protein [Pseudomonadota bacterium]
MSFDVFSNSWQSFLLRGVLAIAFGVVALLLPNTMLTTLVLIFGAFVLVDGLITIASALKTRDENKHWRISLLEGLLAVLVGGFAFFAPSFTGVALILTIGVWAVAAGMLRLFVGIKLRRAVRDVLGMYLNSLAYIVFGALLLTAPIVGAVAIMWCLGMWAIFAGIALVYFAFRLRGK